jgi:hypothetical protein
MQKKFNHLLSLIKEPLHESKGIKTDNSILFIYPPKEELDFRDYLIDRFVPELQAKGIPYTLLDLSGFMFEALHEDAVENLQQDEFDDYKWMKQGLSQRAESALVKKFEELAHELPSVNILVYGTVALYPLIRFGEVLREIRDLSCRVILAFPGEERGGKLHFMNQSDGGNYLAIKIA